MTQTQVKNASDSNAANEQASGLSLLGGVAASPLLLTVASRPVWAQGGMCTPSALASANLSGQHEFTGCSISTSGWKNNKLHWPIAATTKFHGVFPLVEFENEVIYIKIADNSAATTLADVIDENINGNNPGSLASALIAAYLNALSFPFSGGAAGYSFTPQQIINAFNVLHNRPLAEFEALKVTLETANSQFDANTAKPWM